MNEYKCPDLQINKEMHTSQEENTITTKTYKKITKTKCKRLQGDTKRLTLTLQRGKLTPKTFRHLFEDQNNYNSDIQNQDKEILNSCNKTQRDSQ